MRAYQAARASFVPERLVERALVFSYRNFFAAWERFAEGAGIVAKTCEAQPINLDTPQVPPRRVEC